MVTKKEWDELSAAVQAWLDCRGKQELAEAAERARKAGEQLRKDAKPDPDILRKPVDF